MPYQRRHGALLHKHISAIAWRRIIVVRCPFACNFCAVVGMSNRKWGRNHPIASSRRSRISSDLGADAGSSTTWTSSFGGRTKAIADRMARLGMAWWALGRVDELMRYQSETWDAMQRSGLKRSFAAPSQLTDMLKRMNKGGSAAAEQTIELAARMKTTASSRILVRRRQPPIRSRPGADAAFIRASSRSTTPPRSSSTSIAVPSEGRLRSGAHAASVFRRRSKGGSASGGRRSRCARPARRGRTARSARKCATSKAC